LLDLEAAEGKSGTVKARFGADGITICDPNSPQVFTRIYERPI
jgi:hypothetical protein